MNLSFESPVQFQLAQTPEPRDAPSDRPRGAPQAQQRWMALVILLAFGWRMIGLIARKLGQVEETTIQLAARPMDETVGALVMPGQNGTIYYLLIRPWLQFFGTDLFALRYFSVLTSAIAIALMWQVARRMVPAVGSTLLRNLPLLSTLFLAFNPLQLWYSQEGGRYALVVTLVLFSTWGWLQAMWYSGYVRWLSYLLITSIAIYTQVMTVLLLPVHLVWFLLANPLNRQRWKGYGLTLVGFTLPILPLTAWGRGLLAGAVNGVDQQSSSALQRRADCKRGHVGDLAHSAGSAALRNQPGSADFFGAHSPDRRGGSPVRGCYLDCAGVYDVRGAGDTGDASRLRACGQLAGSRADHLCSHVLGLSLVGPCPTPHQHSIGRGGVLSARMARLSGVVICFEVLAAGAGTPSPARSRL